MEKGWEKVFFTGDEFQAFIARDLLAENGINAVVMDHKDSTYLSFGDIEVYTAESDVPAAVKILEQLKKGED